VLPFDRPVERFTACPACERGTVAKLRVTVYLDGSPPVCRAGCTVAQIADALDRLARRGASTKASSSTPAQTTTRPISTTGETSTTQGTSTTQERTSSSSKNDALPQVVGDALPHVVPGVDPEEAKLIAGLGKSLEATTKFARSIGISGNIQRNSRCLVGGRVGCSRAAFFRDGLTGTWKYACFCEKEYLSAAELKASLARGKIRRFKGKADNTQAAVWWRIAYVDCGVLEPRHVPLPVLPPTAIESACLVRGAFGKVLSVRWMTHPRQPITFTWEFAADVAGITIGQARSGIAANLRAGVFVKVGEHPSRSAQRAPAHLYMPGKVGG
jgi:hypothetical protein